MRQIMEGLVSFTSQVGRIDGCALMMKIDVVAELMAPSEAGSELLEALEKDPVHAAPSSFPVSEDTFRVAEMGIVFATLMNAPEDLAEEVRDFMIDQFSFSGLEIGGAARILLEEREADVSRALEPWAGQCSGIACTDEVRIHRAVRDRAVMTVMLLREFAFIVRTFYPIAFIHYVGDAAPGAELGMPERRRLKRDLSLFPAGNAEAVHDLSRDGWICGLLTEEDMHSGRDASHWMDFGVP